MVRRRRAGYASPHAGLAGDVLARSIRFACAVLCGSVALAIAGCVEPADEDATARQPASTPPPPTPAPTPAPVPSTGTATLRWAPPTQTTDGQALSGLAGYRVYYGQATFRLDRNVTVYDPAATMAVVSNLGSGTWFFAVSAFTTTGSESAMSNVVSKYIP